MLSLCSGISGTQDLARLLGPEQSKRILQLESPQALGSAACLIKYLDLLADESLHGKFKLRELALDGHMKLDRAAVRALNLFPQPQEGNRNMSLYSLINKCKTPIGSRLLLSWLKQPLVDKAEIEASHDLVGLLIDQVQVRQSLQVSPCVQALSAHRPCLYPSHACLAPSSPGQSVFKRVMSRGVGCECDSPSAMHRALCPSRYPGCTLTNKSGGVSGDVSAARAGPGSLGPQAAKAD